MVALIHRAASGADSVLVHLQPSEGFRFPVVTLDLVVLRLEFLGSSNRRLVVPSFRGLTGGRLQFAQPLARQTRALGLQSAGLLILCGKSRAD